MKEKDFQTRFGHYIKENFRNTTVFELKSARNDSLPFSVVVDHQIQGLLHAKHKSIYHKIPDVGFQNFADCIFIIRAEAYVVILYPSKIFYGIDVDDFVDEIAISLRKSLTEDRARELSTFSAHI